MRLVFYFLVGVLLGGSCTYAVGQDYAVATLRSYHFDRSTKHNENNLGLGYEHRFDKDYSAGTGFYENSQYRHTTYAWLGVTPQRIYDWRVGIVLGAGTGYACGLRVCPIAGLLVQNEWVNIAFAPSVVALQVKIRIP